MQVCFGVDIGGTTVKIGLFSEQGDILDKWEIPTVTENGGNRILSDVAESVMDAVKRHDLEKDRICGIGVGVPAAVDKNGFVSKTTNLGWIDKSVKKELEERTGFTVRVGNDANMAALGEMWKGGGQGSDNLVMVTLGTGVGGGIIVDGHILFGANGASGEIGHVCVDNEETETCGCGKKGCIEQYASATGIVRLARRYLDGKSVETMLDPQNLTAKDVWDAVKAGDSAAMQIAEIFGQYLGRALADVAAVTDPEVFVIGGGVSKAGDVLIEYVEKYFRRYAFYSNRNTRFSLARLGNDAGICGAAKMICEE